MPALLSRSFARPILMVFTARAMLCAVGYAMALCLCVCVCLCLSQVGVLLKRLDIGTCKQLRTLVQGYSFLMPNIFSKFERSPPPTGAPNADGVG